MAASPTELTCESCGATVTIAASARTARCLYCDSPSVLDRPASPDRPDPVFGIGFRLTKHDALARVRRLLRSRRWAPRSLRRATAAKLEGVYVPAYIYTASAASAYRAEIGEDYYVTRYDAKKKSARRVRKTEYYPLEGQHHCYLWDVVVTASAGLGNQELEAIEPFPPEGLVRFAPGLVSGWTAEEPSLPRSESLELARAEGRAQVQARLRAFMPGDSLRHLQSSTRFDHESLDLAVLPVWVAAVRSRPDREPVRLLVNGQTGAVAGDVPVSWGKIAAAAGAVIGLIALAILIGGLW